MAPRGGRSQSRKNAPVSPRKGATGSAPLRRSARSQSNDIETIPNRRARPSASAEPHVDPDSPATNTRSKVGIQGLSTVDEEVADVLDEPVTEENSLDDVSDVSSADSSEYLSHSQSVLESMDRDSMVIDLPVLFRDAKETLSLFDSLDPARLKTLQEELLNSASRKSKQLKSLLGHFNKSRESYRPKLNYIDVKLVVRGFAQVRELDEVSSGPWRPDALLYMANLVNLVATPSAKSRDEEVISNYLDSLYKVFPEQYAPDFDDTSPQPSSFSTQLVHETARIALEIRTQYAISLLYQRQDMDSTDVIQDVFWDTTTSPQKSLRGFNLSQEDDVLPKAFNLMFKKRVGEILSCCEDNEVDFEELEKRFAWPDFVVALTLWANLRKDELESMIEDEGGVETIQQRLEGEQSAEEVEVLIEHQQEKTLTRNRRSWPRKSAAQDLKRVNQGQATRARLSAVRDKKLSAATAQPQPDPSELPPSAQPMREIPQSPEHNASAPTVGDNDDVSHSSPRGARGIPPPSQQARHVLDTLEIQRTISNKENIDIPRRPMNKFNQRYPDAHKITAEDDEEESIPLQPRKTGKRPAPTQDDDGEDSDAFEADTRHQKPTQAKRARLQAPMESPRLNRLTSHDTIDEVDPEQEMVQEMVDRQLAESSQRIRSPLTPRRIPAPRARTQRPASPPESPTDELPTCSQHQTANREAKLAVAQLRLVRAAAPQTRKAWSVAETDRLVELIGKYGTSWANLLDMDNVPPEEAMLQLRSQVNLKDKARNIKMDYMKSNKDLPPNMIDVKLGVKYEEKLTEAGIKVLEYEKRQRGLVVQLGEQRKLEYREPLERAGLPDNVEPIEEE